MIEYELIKNEEPSSDEKLKELQRLLYHYREDDPKFLTPKQEQELMRRIIEEESNPTPDPNPTQVPYTDIPESNRPNIDAFQDAFPDEEIENAISIFKGWLRKEQAFGIYKRRPAQPNKNYPLWGLGPDVNKPITDFERYQGMGGRTPSERGGVTHNFFPLNEGEAYQRTDQYDRAMGRPPGVAKDGYKGTKVNIKDLASDIASGKETRSLTKPSHSTKTKKTTVPHGYGRSTQIPYKPPKQNTPDYGVGELGG